MSDLTISFEKVLADFSRVPKADDSPTYLEITKVGADRFEERCSQILKFFLTPAGAHGLRGLVLESLLDCMECPDLRWQGHEVRVFSEEATEDRKRIDIMVKTADFVIAIENKIWAGLYNPLDSYARHVTGKYPNHKKFFVVLSVRDINDGSELKRMRENGFCYVNYRSLIEAMRRRMGFFATSGNGTYLTFLLDFIKTIEKMNSKSNEEMEEFFLTNKEAIDRLIEGYNRFREALKVRRDAQMTILRERVSALTGREWSTKWGPLFCDFNNDGNRIGIECSYADNSVTTANPLGCLQPCITVWKSKCFLPYECALRERFPECEIKPYDNDRVDLILPAINTQTSDHDSTAEQLKVYYDFMAELTRRIK